MAHKNEEHIIKLGYLWHYGTIALYVLIPLTIIGICELTGASSDTFILILGLSWGIAFLCTGIYQIIGSTLEYKHILVSIQLFTHKPFNVNPRREWSKSEKKQSYGIGIIFVILGSMLLIAAAITFYGIV